METRLLICMALVACGDSSADGPRSVPSSDVLCQVWESNGIEPGTPGKVAGFGSLSTDVIAAWGQPSERKGNVWTYDWNAAGRPVNVTLTFKSHDLCYDGGKKIGGLWLEKIEAEGIAKPACWRYEGRKDEPTCDGCLKHGEVDECLR